MRTVLVIAPYFPPLARVGALRPLKLVRHLGEFGWRSVVLCLPAGGGLVDPALAQAVPGDVTVDHSFAAGPLWWVEMRARTRTVGQEGASLTDARGALGRLADRARARFDDWTFVDTRLVHAPNAVTRAVTLARRHGARAILGCGDPWSGLVTAALAARATRLPLVCDLRDPWTLEPERFAAKAPLIKALERRVERFVFESSSRVVLNTRTALVAYRDAYPDLPGNRFTFQQNCFDSGLFDEPDGHVGDPGGGFKMVYFGRFRRFRSMDPVTRLLRRIDMDHPELGRRLTLHVVGGVEGEDRDSLEKLGPRIIVRPAVPYGRSLQVLRCADLLILTLAGSAGLQIPAKLYDYLAADRPVLALAHSPEMAGILDETGMGRCVEPDDVRASSLFVADVANGTWRPRPDRDAIEAFSARSMARKIASVLSGVSG